MSNSPPRAPAGLAAAGKRLWESVIGGYELTPGEVEILIALCHAVDQLARLNAALVDAPLTVKGSRGQDTANPLLLQARQTAKTVESLQRALALPAPGEKVGRYTNANRTAAIDARWSRVRTLKAREGSA